MTKMTSKCMFAMLLKTLCYWMLTNWLIVFCIQIKLKYLRDVFYYSMVYYIGNVQGGQTGKRIKHTKNVFTTILVFYDQNDVPTMLELYSIG